MRDASAVVVCTPHLAFVASALVNELRTAGFAAQMQHSLKEIDGFQFCLVLAPHMFPTIDRNYVAVQVEQLQSPRWRLDNYLAFLKKADAIIDYSLDNIASLRQMGFEYGKLFYVPFSIHENNDERIRALAERPGDVLFYGSLGSKRRNAILDYMSASLSIETVSETYGPEMWDRIRNAKVVVNVHYYDDARLEAARIFETLALGTPVVSETAADVDQYPELQDAVTFVSSSKPETLVEAIRGLLGSPDEYAARLERIDELRQRPGRFPSYFRRFLLAQNMIGFDHFTAVQGYDPVDSIETKYCLTLAETPERRTPFSASHPDFRMFNGLRFRPAWKGCALSYKYMFERLAEDGATRTTICEDDALFGPDHSARIALISRYLDEIDGEWDVFSGFIADASDVEIVNIEDRYGIRFVWVRRAVSTVFNIYSPNAIRTLSLWNPLNGDANSNTIDRYMASAGLRFVTTTPFTVAHNDAHGTTLWGSGHPGYAEMNRRTDETMQRKVAEFLGRKEVR